MSSSPHKSKLSSSSEQDVSDGDTTGLETSSDESAVTVSSLPTNSKIYETQKELEKMLRSQHCDPGSEINYAATRYMFACCGSECKLVEMDERLQETVKFNRMADLICPKSFENVSYTKSCDNNIIVTNIVFL